MSLKLKLRGNIWHINGSIKHGGQTHRVRRTTGYDKVNKSEAEAEMSQLLINIISGKPNVVTSHDTLADIASEYLNKPGASKTKTSQSNLVSIIKEFGKVPVKDLSLRDITKHFGLKTVKPSTIARQMTTFNSMMEYARKIGVLNMPDWSLTKPPVSDERCRWLTEDERDQFIYNIDDHARPITAFFFFTGARASEAFRLKGKDITALGASVWSEKGKLRKKKYRSLPLIPEVTCQMASVSTNEYVFKDKNGDPWDVDSYKYPFHQVRERLGIEDFRPHDMRHTFASHLVQKGASLLHVQKLLGHTTMAMVQRYAHLAPHNLMDAVGLLSTPSGLTPSGVPRMDETQIVTHMPKGTGQDTRQVINKSEISGRSSGVERYLAKDSGQSDV